MKKRVHLEFYEKDYLTQMMADNDFANYAAAREPILSERTISLLEPTEGNTEQIARAQTLTAVKDRAVHALSETISQADFRFDAQNQHDKVVGKKKAIGTEWIGICRVVQVTSE